MSSKHSITIEVPSTGKTFNSFSDWHLVPDKLPVINPPEQKQYGVNVPGANGYLDLSETLTGYPIYENRQGSLDFIVLNDFNGIDVDETEWTERFSTIMDSIHGRVIKLILEDDPGFYYTGRVVVSKLEGNDDNSMLSITYSFNPYKWKIESTVDDWLWDSFNFETDYIESGYKDIEIDSPNSFKEFTFSKDNEFTAPVIPIFNVSSMTQSMEMEFINSALHIDVTYPLSEGDNEFFDCVVTNMSDWTIKVKGKGTLSIIYKKGRL